MGMTFRRCRGLKSFHYRSLCHRIAGRLSRCITVLELHPRASRTLISFFFRVHCTRLPLYGNTQKGASDARLRAMLLYFVEQTIWGLSRMNRYSPTHFSQVNRMLSEVYYIASQHAECSPWYMLDGKLKRLVGTFGYNARHDAVSQVTTASAATAALPPSPGRPPGPAAATSSTGR